MKRLLAAAITSALTTLVAAWALRATDPTTAVAAVAAVTVLVAWLLAFHSTDRASGLELSGPAALLSLVLVGRGSAATALPTVAAQVVGAVAAGAAVLALDLPGGTLVWDEPDRLAAACLGVAVGLVVAWTTLAADATGPVWTAAGPTVAGALLGVGLAVAAQPAALVGLAVAGLVGWTAALLAAAGVLVGAAIGTFVVSWVSPHEA